MPLQATDIVNATLNASNSYDLSVIGTLSMPQINAGFTAGFTLAAFLLVVVPGPTVLMVVAYGLRVGPRAACVSALGVVCGDATSLTISLGGVGAIVAVSPIAFVALRWVGAAYLLRIAFVTWRESNAALQQLGSQQLDDRTENAASPDADAAPLEAAGGPPQNRPGTTSSVHIFRACYVVTATNPKGWIFFTAFVPQFLDERLATAPQLVVYGGIFLAIAFSSALAYGATAGRLAAFFTRPLALRNLKRAGAGFLAAAALLTAVDGVVGWVSNSVAPVNSSRVG